MNRTVSRLVVLFVLVTLRPFLLAQTSHQASAHRPQEYTFAIVAAYPHDTAAFTQGLAYRDGFLYEGTGREGHSSLRKVHLETGEIVQQVNLAPDLFGEGITLLNDKVIQLTWKSGIGFVYDLNSFRLLRRFSYSGEGWGLATNGRELFLSDGTPDIRVLDGETLQEKRRLKVHDGMTPVDQLNELEFVQGQIFANIWHSNRVARISPQSGEVVGWIDLTGLLNPTYRLDPEAVLNGIAYDTVRKRLFVTGKLWPRVFEITLSPKGHK
jgi:glutaminyl-peptide cyclotransferase